MSPSPTAEAGPATDRFRLDGHHALVTGAGRGLGRACAVALARAGAGVTLVARTPDDLAATADEIGGGATVDALSADVSDEAEVAGVLAHADRGGRLSIVVHAAGTNRPGPTTAMATADWDAVFAVNTRAAFLLARAAGRAWLERGTPGRLIFLSSQMGHVGYPGRAAYCASKHAVEGLTKALAVEWAPAGITVNTVAPTFVRTAMTAATLDDPDLGPDILRRIPVGAVAEVDDVTGAVVFLASPAARFVTGHGLAVDGGWTAW